MSFMQSIQGHSVVEERQAKGLDLAYEVLENFKGRTFRIKSKALKARGIDYEEVIRFMEEELPEYYQYQTRTEAYVTRKNACHIRISIEGWLGIRCELRRYNPLDLKLMIITE